MNRAFFSSDEVCSHGCGKQDGGRGRQEQAEKNGIFRDMNFGRNIWMEALKVGLNQISCLRAARQLPLQQVCSQKRVCSGLCLRCSWGIIYPISLNLHASVQARRYDENLYHPPFVGSAASVAVPALQISLTERLEP